MKKTVFLSAFSVAAGGMLSAQGLYNLMPFDDEPTDALPLNWTVGASVGYDSNAAPTFSECSGADTDEAFYVSAFVQANWVSKNPQTTIDVWGRAGATYYLDNIEQTISSNGGTRTITVDDDFYPQFRGGLNFVHRVNERLRFRSRSHIAFEQEPDYDYGIATDRRYGSYFRYSSDNSVGYRWTERFATNTGYRLSGVIFDEVDGEDYLRNLFYNQFRYRTAPTTVWTASYRIGFHDNDEDSDSTSHYFLVGVEQEVSPVTVVVLRAGAQLYDPDGGDSQWSPYAEAMIRAALSEAASVRAFVRYGIEDRNRRIATHDCDEPNTVGIYDERKVLRIGTQGSYVLSPKVTVFAGGNLVLLDYDGKVGGSAAAPSSFNESVLNLNVGATFEVYENLYLTTSYNFTNSSSDANIRDYDRHRFQLGVQAAF